MPSADPSLGGDHGEKADREVQDVGNETIDEWV
jgi:hypothetical protein